MESGLRITSSFGFPILLILAHAKLQAMLLAGPHWRHVLH